MHSPVIGCPPGAGPALMELPADLRRWVGDWGLVTMALDSVQAEWPEAGGAPAGCSDRLCKPMMLTLLTYCYAAGIYASEDIELAPAHSPQIRYICAGQHPEADTVRQFRRANRAQIERCLARVLAEAWRRTIGETEWASEPRRPGEAPVRGSIQQLAGHKLQLAVLMDTAGDD